jgi:hypothetical protein
MDATLNALEPEIARMEGNTRFKAEKVLSELHRYRDDFVAQTTPLREGTEAAWTGMKSKLDADWAAFEGAVSAYFESVQADAAPRVAAFQSRAGAQRKAWLEALDGLRRSTAGFAADRKSEVTALVARIKSDAAIAGEKLNDMNRTGGAPWSSLTTALNETRDAFDRANHASYEAFTVARESKDKGLQAPVGERNPG